jgi:hypothetical protein
MPRFDTGCPRLWIIALKQEAIVIGFGKSEKSRIANTFG